jgi:hypothetical protein
VRQTFTAPQAQGTLEVRPHGLKGLVVRVNDMEAVRLTEQDLEAPVVRVDLAPFLVAGPNVVEYHPSGWAGTATVTVVVD